MIASGANLSTAERLNRFALDIYEPLREESGNLFLSPFSIAVCLAMAGAGARGETARQIFEALHLPADDERFHAGLGDLIRRLSQEREGRAYRIEIADSFWGQIGYGFFDAFLDLIRTRYEGELHEVDFERKPESARLAINRWVEEKTQGRIRDIMSPGLRRTGYGRSRNRWMPTG
jgi:serpin B